MKRYTENTESVQGRTVRSPTLLSEVHSADRDQTIVVFFFAEENASQTAVPENDDEATSPVPDRRTSVPGIAAG